MGICHGVLMEYKPFFDIIVVIVEDQPLLGNKYGLVQKCIRQTFILYGKWTNRHLHMHIKMLNKIALSTIWI